MGSLAVMRVEPSDARESTILPDERQALEQLWARGILLKHYERLASFIDEQRSQVLSLTEGRTDGESLGRAIAQLIIDAGSVHPASEMKDQIRAMHDELWFRGEKGDTDRKRITREWTEAHAPAWRRWRIKEYLYVAERCASSLASRIRNKDV